MNSTLKQIMDFGAKLDKAPNDEKKEIIKEAEDFYRLHVIGDGGNEVMIKEMKKQLLIKTNRIIDEKLIGARYDNLMSDIDIISKTLNILK